MKKAVNLYVFKKEKVEIDNETLVECRINGNE